MAKIRYKGAQVVFWDLGGQSKMRSIWERYYNSADAVVFVVDSTDRIRLNEAKREVEGVIQHDVLQRVPIIIFANKQDLPQPMSANEVLSNLLGEGAADLRVFPVSALSG